MYKSIGRQLKLKLSKQSEHAEMIIYWFLCRDVKTEIIADSFHHSVHRITELDCFGTEGFLVDNTVHFNSLTSTVLNLSTHNRSHPIPLACHYWCPIHCNSTQLVPGQFHVIDCSGCRLKNVLTRCGALQTPNIKQLLSDAKVVVNSPQIWL